MTSTKQSRPLGRTYWMHKTVSLYGLIAILAVAVLGTHMLTTSHADTPTTAQASQVQVVDTENSTHQHDMYKSYALLAVLIAVVASYGAYRINRRRKPVPRKTS
jgi:hypothetical protein